MKNLFKKLTIISFVALLSSGVVEALQSIELDMGNRTYSSDTIFLNSALMRSYNVDANNYMLEKVSIIAKKGWVRDEPSLELEIGGTLVDWEYINPNRFKNEIEYTNTVLENRSYADGPWQLNIKSVAQIDKITLFVRNKQQFIMPTMFSAGFLETKTVGNSEGTFYFNNLFAKKLILKGCGAGARVHEVRAFFSDGSSRTYTRLTGTYLGGKIREVDVNKRINKVEVRSKPANHTKFLSGNTGKGAIQALISGY